MADGDRGRNTEILTSNGDRTAAEVYSGWNLQ